MTASSQAPSGEGLIALITRFEAASEGSRELDGLIFRAVSPEGTWHCIDDGVWCRQDAKDLVAFDMPLFYTTSLDAALTLVPEGLMLNIKRNWQPGPWLVHLEREEGGTVKWIAGGVAKSGPLALCTASLKAHQASQGEKP